MERQIVVRLILVSLLLGVAVWALSYRTDLDVAAVETWVSSYGLWAPALFVGLYIAATVLLLPGSVLTIVSGMLFGPFLGIFYSLIGATIGATIAFLVARFLASSWVARKSGERLRKLIDGVEAEGWRFVTFVRLVPLFPFNFLNYALGVTRIRLSHYVLATAVCILPGGFAYTYLGYAGREVAAGDEQFVQKGLIALGLVATVAFLPRFVRRLRTRPR